MRVLIFIWHCLPQYFLAPGQKYVCLFRYYQSVVFSWQQCQVPIWYCFVTHVMFGVIKNFMQNILVPCKSWLVWKKLGRSYMSFQRSFVNLLRINWKTNIVKNIPVCSQSQPIFLHWGEKGKLWFVLELKGTV